MEKCIVYLGNRLSSDRTNPTAQKALEEGLKAEGYKLLSASPVKNQILRFSHMLLVFFRNYTKADFILIDVYSTRNFWYAVLLGRLSKSTGKKYIPILHGGDLKNRFRRSPGATNKLLANAYQIISPSLYLQQEVKKLGFSEVKYIPNPLFLEKYPYKERKAFRPKLLWVRAFDEIYNPLLALKTLKLLLAEFPDAELCMVGPDKDGSMKACKAYAAAHSLPVQFTGKLKKMEWIKLASAFDIFINTSGIDNMPVSVLEAMALGLPVVSTNVGGLPYLIEQEVTGLLLPPGDPRAMADRVGELLKDQEKARSISRAAREKTKEFDWEVIKSAWKDILS